VRQVEPVSTTDGQPWHERTWPRAFFTAVQFLSRIPVPGGATRDLSTFPDDIRRGVVFFPLIGCLIGSLTALALAGASLVVAWPVAVLVALAVEAMLTGAFHEDAVADFCDAFGGGWTREDTLRIMKDSRVGSFGALGLGLAVGLRATALVMIADIWRATFVVIAAGGIARLITLITMAAVPPVPGRDGLSKDIGQEASLKTVLVGSLLIAPVFVFVARHDPLGALGITLAIAVFIVWLRRLLLRRLGGVTGDCLGFAAYAGQLIATIGLSR
jgi:adenosylcobinamide-GDP ribazoletransferase